MADESGRSRLGRGLAALLGDVDGEFGSAPNGAGQRPIPVEFLRRNPRNPRVSFDDATLEELAASIRQRGVIQPIVVRAVAGLPDVYEIIAGERRWRAAQRAGLHEVPVTIVEADDRTALEFAIIENVQRADLNPLEEAAGFDALISQHGYSQADLAQILGKSRSHVANTLRLLKLPPAVLAYVRSGELSAGHARALLAISDPERVASQAVEDGLSVRDVERLAQSEAEAEGGRPGRRARVGTATDADTRALEAALEASLGLIVRISNTGARGELRIRYSDLDQLDSLCRRLQAA